MHMMNDTEDIWACVEVPDDVNLLDKDEARRKLAQLQEQAILISAHIEAASRHGGIESNISDIGEKIRKWLEKAYRAIRVIAEALGAATYSVTVALHTISVSVTFAGSDG